VQWKVSGIAEPFRLDELSDGTVRMLCWATILRSHKLPSLIVIEEPEVGIHPAWLKVLAEWIKLASERTQVIITTHSPDLLDCFTDRLENVYVFNQKQGDPHHFVIDRLSRDRFQSLLEEGWELGDIYRVGDPTLGGWPW
jgi:predicted ATPase